MTPLISILKMRLSSLRNRARHFKKDSLAKTAVVLFGLGNVIGLGFWVAYESFKFIESFTAFGSALSAKMVSLLFFALLILVILSTVIVTYTTIFLARETEFLFQYPLRPRTVFFVKSAEAIAFSSWASLFLCLPVLIAYGYLKKAPASYYPEMALVLMLFLSFAGLAGAVVSVLVAPLVRRLKPRQLLALGGVAMVLLAWVFLRSFAIWDMDGDNNLLILDRFTAQLSAMHSPFFPGNWASSAILAASVGNHREVVFQGGTLLANTLIFLPLLAWYGRSWYGRQWILCHNGDSGAASRKRRRARKQGASETPPAQRAAAASILERLVAGRPLWAVVLKDLKVFLRDPAQVSQSILFLVLMVVYSLSLVRIPEFLTSGPLKLMIFFANLGAVCAILSSFTSRFIFPLISLEGKAFWMVGLAPMPRHYVLHAKASFGMVIILSVGLITSLVSNQALHMPLDLLATALFVVTLAGVCLTSLATGLGAAYPIFDEDNPARIAVGLGGTLNFFASALAVALLIGLEAVPYLLLGPEPGAWVVLAHAAALAFTAILSTYCFRTGKRALARTEF